MPHKFFIQIKRIIDHLRMTVEGKGIERHGDSHLSFHQKFIHFWVLTWKGFAQNRCPVRASALAYTTLLALIPMLAVVASVSTSLLKSQGEKPIEFMIEKLVDNVAPQLDLVAETEQDAKLFATTDFKNPDSLIARLQAQRSEIAQFVWSQLSSEAREMFAQTNTAVDLQRAYLAGEFNELLYGDSLYDRDRFAEVEISPEAREMIGTELDERDRIRLNRMLLEDAFAGDIVRASGRLRVVQTITESIQRINTGGLGVTGMVGLIFVAIMLLSTIEATFNDIWGITHGRSWLARIVQYWATVTLGPLIPILAIALNTGSQIETVENWLATRPVIGNLVIVMKVIPFLVLSIAFALFYQLMPNTRVRWQAALVGGVVGGSLWQLNSLFYVVYASRVATYTNIYGPLSLVPVFLIGLYFSWLILLFGAQVAYTFQNRLAYFQERQSEAVNELGKEFVALRIMTCLAQRFSRGEHPPTEIELGQALAVPTRLVGDIMKTLAAAGLVHEIEGVETGYNVARPLEKLTCQDVLRAVRAGEGEELETREDTDRSLIRDKFLRIQKAEAAVAAELNMAMLVRETARQDASAPSEPAQPGHPQPALKH